MLEKFHPLFLSYSLAHPVIVGCPCNVVGQHEAAAALCAPRLHRQPHPGPGGVRPQRPARRRVQVQQVLDTKV